MSVILEEQKIKEVTLDLLTLLETNQRLSRFGGTISTLLEKDPYYCRYEKWVKGLSSKENHQKEFISRLMWYVYIANATAYSLQYREIVDWFNFELPEEGHGKQVDVKQLSTNMRAIDYNLHTNDGNQFLAEEWRSPFDRFRRFIDMEVSERSRS
jgi:hypothetical protein